MKLSEIFKRNRVAAAESFEPAQFGIQEEQKPISGWPDAFRKYWDERRQEGGPTPLNYGVATREPVSLPTHKDCNCQKVLGLPAPSSSDTDSIKKWNWDVASHWIDLMSDPDPSARVSNVDKLRQCKRKKSAQAPGDEDQNHLLSHIYGAGKTHRDFGIADSMLGERYLASQAKNQSVLPKVSPTTAIGPIGANWTAASPQWSTGDRCAVCKQYNKAIDKAIGDHISENGIDPKDKHSLHAEVFDLWKNGKKLDGESNPHLARAQRLYDSYDSHASNKHGVMWSEPFANTPVINNPKGSSQYVKNIYNRVVNRLSGGWKVITPQEDIDKDMLKDEEGKPYLRSEMGYADQMRAIQEFRETKYQDIQKSVDKLRPLGPNSDIERERSTEEVPGWKYKVVKAVGDEADIYPTKVTKERTFPKQHVYDPSMMTDVQANAYQDTVGTRTAPEIIKKKYRDLVGSMPNMHLWVFQKAGVDPALYKWKSYMKKKRAYDNQPTHEMVKDKDAKCEVRFATPSDEPLIVGVRHSKDAPFSPVIEGDHYFTEEKAGKAPGERFVRAGETSVAKLNEQSLSNGGSPEYDWADEHLPESVANAKKRGEVLINPIIHHKETGFVTKNSDGKYTVVPGPSVPNDALNVAIDREGNVSYRKMHELNKRPKDAEIQTTGGGASSNPIVQYVKKNEDGSVTPCTDHSHHEYVGNYSLSSGYKVNAYNMRKIPEAEKPHKMPTEEEWSEANRVFSASFTDALAKAYPGHTPSEAFDKAKEEHTQVVNKIKSEQAKSMQSMNRAITASKEEIMKWNDRFEKEAIHVPLISDVANAAQGVGHWVENQWNTWKGNNIDTSHVPGWDVDQYKNNVETRAFGNLGLAGGGAAAAGYGAVKGVGKAKDKLSDLKEQLLQKKDEALYNSAVEQGAQHARKPKSME